MSVTAITWPDACKGYRAARVSSGQSGFILGALSSSGKMSPTQMLGKWTRADNYSKKNPFQAKTVIRRANSAFSVLTKEKRGKEKKERRGDVRR